MEQVIPVTKETLHKGILMLVNVPFNLNLSNLEIDIVSTWLQHKTYKIDIGARDLIRKVLNKDKFNTNNYIKRLKQKGIIVQATNTKDLFLNPKLAHLVNSNTITFKFDILN